MSNEKKNFIDLQDAAFKGNVAELNACLDEGIQPDDYGNKEQKLTALIWAARRNPIQDTTPGMLQGKLECLRILIDRGANLSHRDFLGRNVLHHAATENMSEALAILIPAFKEKGLGLDIGSNSKYTALHYAALFRNKEAMLILVAAGADINALDQYKNTPIGIASGKDARNIGISQEEDLKTRKDLFKTLYMLGADYTIPDEDGVAPLRSFPPQIRQELEQFIKERERPARVEGGVLAGLLSSGSEFLASFSFGRKSGYEHLPQKDPDLEVSYDDGRTSRSGSSSSDSSNGGLRHRTHTAAITSPSQEKSFV